MEALKEEKDAQAEHELLAMGTATATPTPTANTTQPPPQDLQQQPPQAQPDADMGAAGAEEEQPAEASLDSLDEFKRKHNFAGADAEQFDALITEIKHKRARKQPPPPATPQAARSDAEELNTTARKLAETLAAAQAQHLQQSS